MEEIRAVRTPDASFEKLPGYDFEPRYIDELPGFPGLRMHLVDAGREDAKVTFLCLHGEPTWAYLYRKMIPVFTGAGYRVIAPDFFGFGRSDKPVEEATFTFGFHRRSLVELLRRLNLRNVCLVVQDWGGILGLTLPVEFPETITRLIVMNTSLPVGESLGEGFAGWRSYVARKPDFKVSDLIKRSVAGISEEEAAAYDAPFPTERARAGLRRFPELVMTDPGMEGIKETKAARDFLSQDWRGASLVAVGAKDPVFGVADMKRLAGRIRGAGDVLEIAEGGHFVQEHGQPIAEAALAKFQL